MKRERKREWKWERNSESERDVVANINWRMRGILEKIRKRENDEEYTEGKNRKEGFGGRRGRW